jgi:hypothetical protein
LPWDGKFSIIQTSDRYCLEIGHRRSISLVPRQVSLQELEPNPRFGGSVLKWPKKFVIFWVLAGPKSDSNILSNLRCRILACFLTHSGIRLQSDFS